MTFKVFATITVVVILCAWGLLALTTYYISGKKSKENEKFNVQLNIDEYTGKWYEIARYPQSFQGENCKFVTAEYTRISENKIKVVNTCNPGLENEKKGTGEAIVRSENVLSVSFFPGIYGNYTVIYYDKETSIVTDNNHSSLWILSRVPEMSSESLHHVLSFLQDNNFDLDKLVYKGLNTKPEY